MKLTQFDQILYETLCRVEKDYAPILVFCDEKTGLQYLPIQTLFFMLPRKYWTQNIEKKTEKSLRKLATYGLVDFKEVHSENLCRSTTPTEIASFKLKTLKKPHAKHIRNRRRRPTNKA